MAMPAQKPGRSKQDYGTPRDFLAAVKQRLGIVDFDIDLAASSENAVTGLFYDEAADSLKQPWKIPGLDGWNWLNPPFARIEPWVRRAYEQARDEFARTAVLVPAGVGANWWRDWVHDTARVLLLNGRLTFVGETKPYIKDCALLLYAPGWIHDNDTGYEVWTWRNDVPKAEAA